MRKLKVLFSFILLIGMLVACSDNEDENVEEDLGEDLPTLDVDFKVPETADVGETINLEAFVTYDDKPEKNAEVVFEIWEVGKEDDSEMLDGENEGDGNYTLDYTFDEEVAYEMYAHTDAEGLHTMPKKQIVIGDAEAPEEDAEDTHAGFHTEGFDMHFNEPENVNKDENTTLETHIMLNDDPLENLNVRYEIVLENDEDNTEWIDAEEDSAGEYSATYAFPEEGTYDVTVHVEDEEDLHEHSEYEITVE